MYHEVRRSSFCRLTQGSNEPFNAVLSQNSGVIMAP